MSGILMTLSGVERSSPPAYWRPYISLPYNRPPSWPFSSAAAMAQHQLAGTAGYQPLITGRQGWRVPYISHFLLANAPDCLWRNLHFLYDLTFLD